MNRPVEIADKVVAYRVAIQMPEHYDPIKIKVMLKNLVQNIERDVHIADVSIMEQTFQGKVKRIR